MDEQGNPHFRLLESIAGDLSGEVNFPTCLDAAVLVRNTLRDPEVSLDRVATVIGSEALIASKLLRLANSVHYNPGGRAITDLRNAVSRLGFETVRTVSLAVAMDQMVKARHLGAFTCIARETWDHSLRVAAIARVLARRIGRINQDEAMVAGMVRAIGVFYLLFRAAERAEYREDRALTLELLRGWQGSIGEGLLQVLGLPERIVGALQQREPNLVNPCSLGELIFFASLLATPAPEWLATPQPPGAEDSSAAAQRYADLLAEAEEDMAELRAALAA